MLAQADEKFAVKHEGEIIGYIYPNGITSAMLHGTCVACKQCATHDEGVAWLEERRLENIEVQKRVFQFTRRLRFIEGFNEVDKPATPLKFGPPHSFNWRCAVSYLNAWLAGQRYGIEQNKSPLTEQMLHERCANGNGFPLDDDETIFADD